MNHVKSTAGFGDPTGFETLEIISHAKSFNKWMYQRIQSYLRGNILEIGSGIGNISEFVVNDGYTITLSDYNPAYAEALAMKYGTAKNVQEIITIDLQDPDFFSAYLSLRAKYDTIFLLNVIEHLQDDAKAIEYCAYMLKPAGRLILLAPAYQSLFSRLDTELGHYRRYRVKDFEKLLKQERFTVIQKQYFNFLGLAGWLVYGRIAGQKQLTAGNFNLFNKLVPIAKILDRLIGRKAGLSVIVTGEKNS